MGKAKQGVNKYSEYEICEQIRLSYLEYENASLLKIHINPSNYITDSLKRVYGEGAVRNVSLKNKKLKVTIGEKTYQYNISTGVAGEYVDPINYGTKTQATIAPEDDIIIGGTEKFKVFSKSATEIKAMPYYNLKIKEMPIKQAIATDIFDSYAGTSWFSTSCYWNLGEDEIDMNDSRNLIQQYIIEYKKTLEELGVEGIEVRAGKYSELSASEITDIMRNPGEKNNFFLVQEKLMISLF